MFTRENLKGLLSLPPTPYKSDQTYWSEAFKYNCEKLIEFGVSAIVGPGTNGEWWSLNDQEREQLMFDMSEVCLGKVPTATCTSSTFTADSIYWTKKAKEAKLDGVMNVPPFYFPLKDEELRKYWHDLANACPDIGLIIYNMPPVAQVLSNELQIKLDQEIPSICGSKESHLDFSKWVYLHDVCEMRVYSAVERVWFTSLFHAGAEGIYSTLSASFPTLIMKLFQACTEQSWEEAHRLEKELWKLTRTIESRDYLKGYNPLAVNKAIVNASGWLIGGESKAPLITVSKEHIEQLREDLKRAGESWLAPDDQRATL